ncbi:sialidase family protein [Streptomyces acidicola]|uniref:sialidase family protein n=1 Tax=Streptomyces acidicola TaxID=2596892 RepID=UPI00380369BF
MAVVSRTRAWPLLLTALVLAVLTGLLTPPPASAEGTSGETSVYINTATEGDGPRTPDIISTSANNAVVVWREGLTPNKVDMGYIRYSYTTDGGATWSRPQVLAQESSEWAWHYVILYKSGNDLFAYLGRSLATATNGLPIKATVAKRSTDEGHTWQDYPIQVPNINNLIFAGRPLKLANGKHVIPYWAEGRENGVLISSDLKNWTQGGTIDGAPLSAGEPQLAVSQDDPNELVMVARSAQSGAATATSTDGGLHWTPFRADANLPSYNIAKSYFTKDSNGKYLYIYNAGTDSKNRDVLNYKVKRPGAAWSTGKLFADGPASQKDPTPVGTGEDWDTYAMADEYAPGKFYVAWEFDTSRIKVNKLDVSDITG